MAPTLSTIVEIAGFAFCIKLLSIFLKMMTRVHAQEELWEGGKKAICTLCIIYPFSSFLLPLLQSIPTINYTYKTLSNISANRGKNQ